MRWRTWRLVLIEVVLFFVGLVSLLLSVSIFTEGKRAGELSLIGWFVGATGFFIFIVLFLRIALGVTKERREYQGIVRTVDLAQAPADFIASVKDKAEEFRSLLGPRVESLDIPTKSLKVVTEFLHEKGSGLRDEPELVALAAAYVGEVLRRALGGRWVVGRGGWYKDAAVQVRKGLTRHKVSPGLLVLRVAEDPEATLEGFVAHVISESSAER